MKALRHLVALAMPCLLLSCQKEIEVINYSLTAFERSKQSIQLIAKLNSGEDSILHCSRFAISKSHNDIKLVCNELDIILCKSILLESDKKMKLLFLDKKSKNKLRKLKNGEVSLDNSFLQLKSTTLDSILIFNTMIGEEDDGI